MSSITEAVNSNPNNDISNVSAFSNFMHEYYYACKLNFVNTNEKNQLLWTCGKFSNFVDAEKFNTTVDTSTNTNIILRKIIPSKCANPFTSFEPGYLSDKLNIPIELTNFIPVKK